MAEAPAHETTAVVFELDRFEKVGEDRLEIVGRWSGVRGRRFIRPSLTVGTNGSSDRLLADLADKPWPPEGAGPWRAVFVADGAADLALEAPELAVAPDISIQLPEPSAEHDRDLRIVADGRDGSPATGSPSKTPSRPREARPKRGPTVAAMRSALASAETTRLAAQAGQEEARDKLAAAEAQLDSLRAELATARAQAAAALEAEQAAREQLDAVREDLRALAAERDRIISEHYTARSERDGALAERDAAVAERQAAAAERDSALSERDGMRAARDVADRRRAAALAERDEALQARGEAIVQRDTALAAREAALAEREAILEARHVARDEPMPAPVAAPETSPETDALRRDVARLRRERDALLAERDSWATQQDAATRAAAALRGHPVELPALQSDVGWARRGAAVAVLLVFLIALSIITHMV